VLPSYHGRAPSRRTQSSQNLPVASLVPLYCLQDLAIEYSVDPEIIFALYRPLIRGIEPPGTSDEQHDEEGEIAEGGVKPEKGKGHGTAAHGGTAHGTAHGPAEPMDEEGEVAASPSAKAAVAGGKLGGAGRQQRWEELEQQVGGAQQSLIFNLALHAGPVCLCCTEYSFALRA
jgi:hypothetical protein